MIGITDTGVLSLLALKRNMGPILIDQTVSIIVDTIRRILTDQKRFRYHGTAALSDKW